MTVMVNLRGVPTQATYVDWSAKYDMPTVRIGDREMPRKVLSIVSGGATSEAAVSVITDVAVAAPEIVETETIVPINTRFAYLSMMVGMVATATPTSLIITGSGGLGKTFTVLDKLTEQGLEEDEDYVLIKGYTTPKSMYRTMHDNRDKIIVFDDCDSVLTNETAVNLLKAALESMPTRRVAWMTERGGGESEDSLPSSFDFIGKVIFISNKRLNQIPQALLSRALYVDVTMTAPEKIERMRNIAPNVRPELPLSDKLEVIDMLDTLKTRTKDLNIRTMLKCLDIRQSAPADQWKAVAEYVVTTGTATE